MYPAFACRSDLDLVSFIRFLDSVDTNIFRLEDSLCRRVLENSEAWLLDHA